MPFNKLTGQDKEMIAHWIATNGPSEGAGQFGVAPNNIPLEYVLRFWNESKSSFLFQLLGNNLIVEKKVSYERPMRTIEAEVYEELHDGDMYAFKKLVMDFGVQQDTDWWYTGSRLFDSWALAENRYSATYGFTFPKENGKHFIVTPGTKPMRILHKIAKIIKAEEEFEKFRIAHSRILNNKITKGTLCLSIHPFDYMTMSDNSYNWSSCMSWTECGSYRAGTVEMLNSEYVLVAYLKGEKPYPFYRYSWDGNKKWRQLMVVHPQAICNIKGYPYFSKDLTELALEWIAELARTNLGWDIPYGKVKFHLGENFVYEDENTYNYNFDFDVMYNDFDSSEEISHYIIIPQDNPPRNYRANIFLSGTLSCMGCGKVDGFENSSESCVMCSTCVPRIECSCCGQELYSDEMYEIDGELYCYNCFQDNFTTDALTGEYISTEDTITIYLTRNSEFLDIYKDSFIETSFYNFTGDNMKAFSKYFNCSKIRMYRDEETFTTYYYLFMEDCTEMGLRNLFGIWDPERYRNVEPGRFRTRIVDSN